MQFEHFSCSCPLFRLTCGLAVHAHAPVPGVGERPAFGSTSSHADLLWLRFHAFTSAYPGFRIPHEMMHAKTSFDGSSFISSVLVVSCFALEDERRRLCLLTDLSDLTTNPKDISFWLVRPAAPGRRRPRRTTERVDGTSVPAGCVAGDRCATELPSLASG